MSVKQKIALKYIRAKFKLLSSLSKRKAAEKAFELFCTPQYRNTKELPPIFLEAEKHHFQFHKQTVQGYRWNHPSDKKALILHGFESSVVNFERYVKPLIKKGYEVLAFDAPAHGRSTGKTFNALLYKELIQKIWDKFGPIDAFIAHSLGGLALSLFLESLQPNHMVKAVLIAPATETTTAVDMFFRILNIGNGLREDFNQVIIEQGGQPQEWYSVARASEHIKSQVLWAHDVDDDLTPISDIEKVQQRAYPNFRFFITEGLGHRRIYRDAKVAAEIINFL